MAKRSKPPEPPKRTMLTTRKSAFSSEINDLIKQGFEIFQKEITTVPELELLERDGYNWEDLVSEYLKHAFNNPENEYMLEFDSAGSFIGMEDVLRRNINTNHPAYKLEKFKERIDAKLNNLKRLIAKLKYLPSEVESSQSSSNETFSDNEKEELNSKIDQVLSKLDELQLGQEIVYNEIDELRNLLSLDKKNWRQLLKGKLVDLGIEKIVDTDTLHWIYKTLTDENFNLLK